MIKDIKAIICCLWCLTLITKSNFHIRRATWNPLPNVICVCFVSKARNNPEVRCKLCHLSRITRSLWFNRFKTTLARVVLNLLNHSDRVILDKWQSLHRTSGLFLAFETKQTQMTLGNGFHVARRIWKLLFVMRVKHHKQQIIAFMSFIIAA